MKFKVEKGSQLFEKLTAFQKKCNSAKSAAGKLAKEVAGKETDWTDGNGWHTLCGGITSIKLDSQPEGWRKSADYKDMYFPIENRKANKEILDRIKSLPRVFRDELNEIVSYQGFQDYAPSDRGHGKKVSLNPSVEWSKKYILLSLPDGVKYTPPEGMVEITYSEYEKLRKEK